MGTAAVPHKHVEGTHNLKLVTAGTGVRTRSPLMQHGPTGHAQISENTIQPRRAPRDKQVTQEHVNDVQSSSKRRSTRTTVEQRTSQSATAVRTGDYAEHRRSFATRPQIHDSILNLSCRSPTRAREADAPGDVPRPEKPIQDHMTTPLDGWVRP